MPKHLVNKSAITGFLAGLFLLIAEAGAQSLPPVTEMLAERVLGKADAPVTLMEYASMTCPHCAAFHNGVYGKIKKEFIETGKVKLIYRDFPLDNVALAAAMMARCAPRERYFGIVEIVYRTQQLWRQAENPRQALANIARFAQISEETFNSCLSSQAVQDGVLKQRADGVKEFKVDSTPTLLLNGEKINSSMTDDEFRQVLNKAVAAAK